MKASEQQSSRLRILASVAAIALATLAVYWPALHGGFLIDDNKLLTENPLLRVRNGLQLIWFSSHAQDYWPLTNTSLWIEWRLWGLDPTGYHLTNLALHIAASLLIWGILRKLAVPGAFLAALLFAVHPVNVESVAWIAQRKNTLAMVFFLLSIWWYLRDDEARGASGFSRWYWFSLLAFVLAMLSKGSVAILPLVLLLIIWWQRDRISRAELLRSVPFFSVAGVLTAVNIWFQTHGTGEVIRSASVAERLAGAGAALWFYWYKALIPMDLEFVYPQWQVAADKLLWWLPSLAAAAFTALLFWQRKSAWGRPVLFAWLYYLIAILPALGFTDVGFMKFSLVADHYQHIALIGAMALIAAACAVWYRASNGPMRTAAAAVVVVLIASRMFLTLQQSALFGNPLLLYQVNLQKNPDSWFLHEHMAIALDQANRSAEALPEYQEAIRLNPDDADSHYNFGILLDKLGQFDDAIEHYQKALRIEPENPAIRNNLAIVLARTNRLPEAIEQYQQALRIAPYYADAHYNLGNALVRSGNLPEAIAQYRLALESKPELVNAHTNLGNALINAGRAQEAAEQFELAAKYEPDSAAGYLNLATALQLSGHREEALAEARKALSLARAGNLRQLETQIEGFLNSNRDDQNTGPDKTTPLDTPAAR